MAPILKSLAKALFTTLHRASYFFLKCKSFYYSAIFKKCGANLCFYGKPYIKNPHLITVGNNVTINDGAYLNGLGGLEIGDNVAISACAIIVSTGLDTSTFQTVKTHINKSIRIGNNVQIGAGAIILSGVTIEDNVIVGAGGVVTRNKQLLRGHIYVGNPARMLREFEKPLTATCN